MESEKRASTLFRLLGVIITITALSFLVLFFLSKVLLGFILCGEDWNESVQQEWLHLSNEFTSMLCNIGNMCYI